MATEFLFSIANDTANAKVDSGALQDEIVASKLIAVMIDGVQTGPGADDLWVRFLSDLSAQEETYLSDLVAAHKGSPVDEDYVQSVELVPNAAAGLPVVSSQNVPPTAANLRTSWQVLAAPQTLAHTDVRVGDGLVGPTGICHLAGGEYRCRKPAEVGSSLHLELVDRDNTTGIFPLLGYTRTRLILTTVTGGAPQVGDFAVGQDTGARSEVLAIIDATTIEITFESGWDSGFQRHWKDGEAIVFEAADGTPTGVTATEVDWEEGDFYPIQKFVKDEWIEGMDVDQVRPGGSRVIPPGFYLRMSCWNNHNIDSLRVKISLDLGLE